MGDPQYSLLPWPPPFLYVQSLNGSQRVEHKWKPLLEGRDQQTYSAKGQRENTLGFEGHFMVSISTTQLCGCNWKAAIDKM